MIALKSEFKLPVYSNTPDVTYDCLGCGHTLPKQNGGITCTYCKNEQVILEETYPLFRETLFFYLLAQVDSVPINKREYIIDDTLTTYLKQVFSWHTTIPPTYIKKWSCNDVGNFLKLLLNDHKDYAMFGSLMIEGTERWLKRLSCIDHDYVMAVLGAVTKTIKDALKWTGTPPTKVNKVSYLKQIKSQLPEKPE